jgi:hypothetical protein
MRRSLIALTIPALALAALAATTGIGRAEHWPLARPSTPWTDPSCPAPAAPPYAMPGQPTPGTPTTPGTQAQPTPANPAANPAAPEPSFSPITSSALGDSFVAMTAPGYLDPAAPASIFRLRFDAEYGINRPDRAEFYYPKCGCFGANAPGPPLPETSIDSQELQAYIEYAPSPEWSVFVEMPYRMINPDQNANANGIGDVRYGAKGALLLSTDRILSVQLKGYAPSGDPRLGLGTNHWSLEPSLLYWRKLSDKIQIYGQLGDWIPIGGTDFAGNVLDYGVGVSYTAVDGGCYRICPIVELLGWTCLGGKEFTGLDDPMGQTIDANGITIVNAKFGVRVETDRQSVYVGYGHALTDAVWYRDIVRLEYRLKY